MNSKSSKLTNPQLKLLADVEKGKNHCVEYYRPAQTLVAKGYCIWRTLSRLEITDAGKSILERQKP